MTERLAYAVDEASVIIGIGETLCRELIRTGALGHVRAGRRILVPAHALEVFLDCGPTPPSNQSTEGTQEAS